MNVTEMLLQQLAEEAAEIIQAVSKIQRFGSYDVKPGTQLTNIAKLAQELNDLAAVVDELQVNGFELDNHGYGCDAAARLKREKIRHYLAVSRQLGTLQGEQAVGERLSPLYTHVSYPLEQPQ